MGFLTGLVVDYGYDKLIENFHLDTAKEDFASYLLTKDSDLNKEQADILASAAIKVTKEAGRILTHKMAANGVQALRRHFAEKGPKVFKAPEVPVSEGGKINAPKIEHNLSPYELEITHKITKSKTAFEKLKMDIQLNGIQDPIKFVEHNGKRFVVDGHHRLRAAKELSIQDIPVQKVELPYAGYKKIDDLIYLD